MSGSIKGTKTEQNVLASFAGESQARNRYTFFSKVAEKEGYLQIAEFFRETAENERAHAKTFFKFLEGGPVEITATYPAGKIGSTMENLKASAAGENEEWTELYPDAAKVAREEGFDKVAEAFEAIAKVEAAHEQRYLKLAASIEQEKVFKKDETVKWKCQVCGYIHEGTEAPVSCPACRHPQKHYELLCENY